MKAFLLRYGPYDDLKGWLRGLGVALAFGLFLAISGAFGSGDLPFPRRLAYWLSLMALGTLWGSIVARFFLRRGGGRRWLNALAAAVVMSAPFSLVVWAASNVIVGAGMPLGAVPFLFMPVFVVSLAMVVINVLIEGRPAGPEQNRPPKFLERLPLKLRSAEVWAVEAEDHYLRLHTSMGQDLILLRLADAVAELEGVEGAQVHRSWWVARDAIVDARRGDGRAILTLKDGAEVPVSRTYAGALRERGWI